MSDVLQHIANKLRILSILSTSDNPNGNSGHPTTCCSCAEIISVLFFDIMKYDRKNRKSAGSDRFVLSKGHAAPILYGAWVLIEDAEANNGSVNLRHIGTHQKELVTGLRVTGNKYEGHPTPLLDFIDVATGSLGQGLNSACGMAYCGKYIDKADYRVYCVLGDGECAEGSVYEAMQFASFYKLNNLIAVVDINRLGQSDPTMYQHDIKEIEARWEAFGWNVTCIDGHSITELQQHLSLGLHDKPTALLCRTFKGKGLKGIENMMGFHGKPVVNPGPIIEDLTASLPDSEISIPLSNPRCDLAENVFPQIKLPKTAMPEGAKEMSIRKMFGTTLNNINYERLISLDGDMKNSTFAQDYQKQHPDRFIECYIAEQNMIGVGLGLACRDRCIVFTSTFSAFFSRAYDHIRMAAISQTNLNFAGSHCGVSIGPDGPSQMALEDIAMFRALPTSTVFYPSDGFSAERAIEMAANTKGICYIRMTREELPTLYTPQTEFALGKAHVIRESSNDVATIVTGGITLRESLIAYDILAKEGISIRIIDLFTIKPIDRELLHKAAKETGYIITVEDHYPEGGLGEAVLNGLAGVPVRAHMLAVSRCPFSGVGRELLKVFKIDSSAIVNAVKQK